MDDRFLLRTDGVCVYMSAGIKSSVWGKLLLLLGNGMVVGVLVLAVVWAIPGLMVFDLLIWVWLGRYTLWNIYGQEHLIINTKSLSFQHDYGFFKLAYKTVPLKNKLKILVLPSKETKVKELYIQFVSYNDTDLPVEVYQMAIPILEINAVRLSNMVKQLYVDKLSEEYALPFVNLN
ncbi:hypothetical protein [Mucilaginibacter psychrotolerans]|uniref:Uncharacterized protein n=1 Tax=Mucilaginibacter psychrotolerans TaxID=1524096 RepID=A0A4Y8SH90_9SPHI|nr:hypothetical protein [Mucilaginibacter psychrotolerans]TFF38041.1 hypothetical protein E2R66_10695 [Mucilaginibacter psychrotolerans]